MCNNCKYTGKLMNTGDTFREMGVKYQRYLCPICEHEEFEVVYVNKKQKKNNPNRLLNLISASITVMSVFIGTFYVFSHLEKFTTIFIK